MEQMFAIIQYAMNNFNCTSFIFSAADFSKHIYYFRGTIMSDNFFDYINKNSGINLTNQQKSAVLHTEGPALVLASPGSGKTTMLICRTKNLISSGVNPKNILTLTFNKAAVKDMERRYESLFGKSSDGIHFSTIHAFALKLVKNHYNHNRKSFTIIEGSKSSINKSFILKKLYKEENGEYPGDEMLDELSSDISYVKNMMTNESEFKSDIRNFSYIFRKYEEIKKEHDFIDFDDMLTKAFFILQNNVSMLSYCRKQFNFIQIDEGQDNSKIQNSIIKLIASPKNNIFIVADDDQSIYGFRGAFPEAVLNFNVEYKEAHIFLMEQNFRSTKAIVNAADKFIKTNKKRYDKNLFTQNEAGSSINILNFKDEDSETDFLIKEIKNSRSLSDVAVLYRNNISSIVLIDKFERNGIPFYIRDANLCFFKSHTVLDILAYIQLALDNSDIEAFLRICFKCGCFISRNAVEYIKANYRHGSVFTALKICPFLSPFQVRKIASFEMRLKALTIMNPSKAMGYIENVLNYNTYIEENSKKSGCSLDSIKTSLECLNLIAENTNTLIEFMVHLDYLQDIMKNAPMNRNKDAVTLSTVHSAKGLEFENVYMMDLCENIFPTASSADEFNIGNTIPLEEERRLFYVGMTRAKKNLTLCTLSQRNDEKCGPSRFIAEVSSKL